MYPRSTEAWKSRNVDFSKKKVKIASDLPSEKKRWSNFAKTVAAQHPRIKDREEVEKPS
jgi:hypothetical protein